MNKLDLINKVAQKGTYTKKEAEAAVEAIFEIISKSLEKGDKVTLTGFGTFNVTKRAARKGRNPKTGQEIMIAAKKVPKFTPGKSLKATVNQPV